MALKNVLSDLAAKFANEVLAAIRGASLDELVHEPGVGRASRSTTPRPLAKTSGRPHGRLARRSKKDILSQLDKVMALVKASKGGLRAEQIRAKLGLDRREMPRVLKEGLATKKLRSKGKKRATTYMAA